MELSKLNIEELVKLRTTLILEKKSTKEINEMIDKKEEEYVASLKEDTSGTGGPGGAVSGGGVGSGGIAFSNAGIAGMGNIVASQPSSLAGSTIGNNWSDNGGTIGSGDVSFPFPSGGKNLYQKSPIKTMGKQHGARTGKKSRVKPLDLKALKNTFSKRQDYTTNATSTKKVMNFDDFTKSNLTKVTHVKQ